MGGNFECPPLKELLDPGCSEAQNETTMLRAVDTMVKDPSIREINCTFVPCVVPNEGKFGARTKSMEKSTKGIFFFKRFCRNAAAAIARYHRPLVDYLCAGAHFMVFKLLVRDCKPPPWPTLPPLSESIPAKTAILLVFQRAPGERRNDTILSE